MKKKYLIAAVIAAVVLAIAFFAGDSEPEQSAEPSTEPILRDVIETPYPSETAQTEIPPEQNIETEEPKEKPRKVETEVTQAPVENKEKNVCTLSVSCKTLLTNKEKLADGKADLVPGDGIVLPETSVVFTEGETVFDITKRVLKENNIHYEFSETPIYKSVYTEGIGNIYEFDCGELSGWMYCVNGAFLTIGCSEYIIKNGDRIQWLYSCDMGADIGGGFKTDDEWQNE